MCGPAERKGSVVTAAVNDDSDQTIAETDQAIIQAIGDELRRARNSAGWTRPDLVNRLKPRIPVNTYACYEQGIRPCPIPRLVQICQALGVSAASLLSLALQRLELELDKSGVQIDLQKIIHDERDELQPLRQWARNRIHHAAPTADSDEPTVVRVQWIVVKEMAIFCGVPKRKLLDYIRDFTPESALQP